VPALSASLLQVFAQSPTATPTPGAASGSPPHNWGWVLVLIAGGGLVVLGLLFLFYKRVQDSTFIEKLLGLPIADRARSLRRSSGGAGATQGTPRKPTAAVFRFADEFLARRAEFWLLYAQAYVATFFVAVVAALMLVRVIEVQAGLPALSTVVGIVLGKTLLSPKGTPLSAQEQAPAATGPANTRRPKISPRGGGAAAVGVELTADPGEWSGQLPIRYAYTWRRRGTTGESEIEGTTGATYTPEAADSGSALAVAVTASNAGGSTTVVSDYVSIA
jgi:hypothetical protein